MYKLAVIKRRNPDELFVVNVIEAASIENLDGLKETLAADYVINIPDGITIEKYYKYDPDNGRFFNLDGRQVWPLLTIDERLYNLEKAVDNYGISRIKVNEAIPTLKRDFIINVIKKLCENIITNGFDYKISENEDKKHYALSSFKQKDLESTYMSILNNPDINYVLWRDESIAIKEEYTKDQFVNLYEFLMTMIQACKVYSDFLEVSLNELNNIPNLLSEALATLMKPSDRAMETVVKYLNTYIKNNKFTIDTKLIYSTMYNAYNTAIHNINDIDMSGMV